MKYREKRSPTSSSIKTDTYTPFFNLAQRYISIILTFFFYDGHLKHIKDGIRENRIVIKSIKIRVFCPSRSVSSPTVGNRVKPSAVGDRFLCAMQ